jgi:hypothetical protein
VVQLSFFSSCRREVVLSPPQLWVKLPWDASCGNSCTYGGLPPLPPQHGIAPSGHYFCGVHPNSQLEVHVKFSGVVIGCISFSAGDAQVTTCSFLNVKYHMKVVKYVKMKPPEVTLLELLLICAVHGRLQRNALPAAKRLGGIVPNFKSPCRSPRKLEWCLPQLMHRRA